MGLAQVKIATTVGHSKFWVSEGNIARIVGHRKFWVSDG